MNFFQVYLMVGAIVFLGVAFAVYWFVKTGARDDTRHR